MIDIDVFLRTVMQAVQDKKVPIVDLIAVQTEDPFKVLVATILSARTKDETTAAASARLFAAAADLKGLAALSGEKIAALIYPVGFYKNKAAYLARLPQALARYNNVVPDTVEQLITLPGVGRKTANLVVAVAYKKPAICVDTHVHRIMNIWEYVTTATPLETEMALREKLPARHWLTVNSLLVAFGQSICRPVGPHCDACPLLPDCPQRGVAPRRHPGTTQGPETGLKKFISWNVNGIRAVEKKGFVQVLQDLDADIIALQETKARKDQLSEELKNIPGYTSYWHSAERKGYSGVAIYSRLQPMHVLQGLGDPEFDCEGRVLTLEFPSFFFVTAYFPNSADGLKRLDFKLRFNKKFLDFAQDLARRKCVVICGDYNVAHKEIDLTNPARNTANAGFTPEERHWMDTFVQAGFVDTFRIFHQDPGHYTWWSYRFNARSKDIGWRIDYFCVDVAHAGRVDKALILKDIMGSDHCPVQIDFRMDQPG
ncbi:MAG: exodeoxyribonuclease III [Desulfocapsaceae bacterium]|nr:exodeoxyribonuclease III [Desulfocapsaceae bacterium]